MTGSSECVMDAGPKYKPLVNDGGPGLAAGGDTEPSLSRSRSGQRRQFRLTKITEQCLNRAHFVVHTIAPSLQSPAKPRLALIV